MFYKIVTSKFLIFLPNLIDHFHSLGDDVVLVILSRLHQAEAAKSLADILAEKLHVGLTEGLVDLGSEWRTRCQRFTRRHNDMTWWTDDMHWKNPLSVGSFSSLLTPAPIIDPFRAWKPPLCHKDKAQGIQRPLERKFLPFVVSLWHKRACVATPWSSPTNERTVSRGSRPMRGQYLEYLDQ